MNADLSVATVASLTLISNFALLLATTVYAVLTYRISLATQAAADSAKRSTDVMTLSLSVDRGAAEDLSLQRRAATEPVLALMEASFDSYGRSVRSIRIKVRNFGRGPAFSSVVRMEFGGLPAEFAFASVIDENDWAVAVVQLPESLAWRRLECFSALLITSDVFGNGMRWVQEVQVMPSYAGLEILGHPQRVEADGA